MKVMIGLGNPGPEYDATRHNVGWWVADRLAHDWGFGAYQREGCSLITEGMVSDTSVSIVKPTTYMNRSGLSLQLLREMEGFDPSQDLLIAVDDAALDVGRVRFRSEGGPGGHNGLRSISRALGSNAYPRLKIGVGRKPEGVDLSDWVLSPMPEEDEDIVVELLSELTEAVEVWITAGVETAMNRFNK
jgi:PTH1 family peptidyl-tRNA hydrolase